MDQCGAQSSHKNPDRQWKALHIEDSILHLAQYTGELNKLILEMKQLDIDVSPSAFSICASTGVRLRGHLGVPDAVILLRMLRIICFSLVFMFIL